MKGLGSETDSNEKKADNQVIFTVPFQLKQNTQPINLDQNDLLAKAFQMHSDGFLNEAKNYYKDYIDNGFKDFRAFCNYGIILKSDGELKEAEVYMRKAIELQPNFSDGYANLGNILKELGQLKEAEFYARKSIELKPLSYKSYSNLGILLRDIGKLKEGEICLRKAIKIQPKCAKSHNNLGTILKDIGKLKEAEFHTKKAIELQSDFAIAYSNMAIIMNELRNLKEAEKAIREAIRIEPNFAQAHNNLGFILKDLGKLKEAEISIRKAISLKPDYAEAYSNLGGIFGDLGKFEDSKKYIKKAISINPYLARCYYILSTFKEKGHDIEWQKTLFSEMILKKNNKHAYIDIYFARSNILHKNNNFLESQKNLKLANDLKLANRRSDKDELIRKTNILLVESNMQHIGNCLQKTKKNSLIDNIFIVGMPRSGSTLLESIISMNEDVSDLGEINIFEESYLEWKNLKENDKNIKVLDLYLKNVKNIKGNCRITTDKWLFNYQYVDIILKHIPSAKIIHCFRNPLDNILSIYRANFAKGNSYSSSLGDCSEVYLNHDLIMSEYKKRNPLKIYNLNYDILVNNPKYEIKELINWLGWAWNDFYLSPHLNTRTVSTASSVQVRSPINNKSVGGWKKYHELLEPAIKIITNNPKFNNLI